MEVRQTNGRCYVDGRRTTRERVEQLMIQARMFGHVDAFVTVTKNGRTSHIVQVRT